MTSPKKLPPLRPLRELQVPSDLLGVLTDIDDTLTENGTVSAETIAAMQRLKDAGHKLVAITGRPVGWSEPFAAAWPMDAIVAENGAVALVRDAATGQVQRHYYLDNARDRAVYYDRMQTMLLHIENAVPGAVRARDSHQRECDIAIDHNEFNHLPRERVLQCMTILLAAGMQATVSSIHINAWYGQHNKLKGAAWILDKLWGINLQKTLGRWVYIGDSTNDQAMFERLPLSVGVANIRHFLPDMQHLPAFLTPHERGVGFAELVDHILAATPARRDL